MPNSNLNQGPGQDGASIDLSSAPGSNMSFDDLFPVEPENASQAPLGTTPQQPTQTPQEPVTPQHFLRSVDGKIVYDSAEEAIKGISHKDALIERQRNFLSAQGYDPNTLQLITRPEPQAPTAAPTSPYTYLDNGDKLFDDLTAAATKGDKKAWVSLMRQYNTEVLANEFAPIAPLISEVARQRAVRQVTQEAPDFSTFQASPAYRATLEKLPRLKQAIDQAENNFQMADALSELYQMTYLIDQGLRKNAEPPVTLATPVVQSAPNPPTARPTMSSSTMSPPQPTSAPDLTTSQGRQQLIKDMEARGIKDRQW